MQQHRRIARRHFDERAGDLLHHSTLADDALEPVALLQVFLQPQDGGAQLAALERVGDEQLELVEIERLADVVVSAFLHRLDRRLDRTVCGHDDRLEIRVGALEAPDHLETGHAAELQVGDDQIDRLAGRDLDGLLAAVDRAHGVFLAERLLERGAVPFLILDQ